MLTIAFVYLAADFLGPEIRERGWGFFRNSDYGVSSDVWWKKGGTWEPRRRHVWREYFWQTVMGYIVFIDNEADNLFPRCLSRSTQMRYDPLEHTTTEAADYRFYY